MDKNDRTESDSFDLRRFVDAQQGIYQAVLEELRAGRKQSHWMWFVFPQLAGLGSSAMARRYAIGSMAEARAYSAHPVLGQRLRECSQLVSGATSKSIEDIFGYPDYLKFHSCMTLFAHAGGDTEIFERCLLLFFEGRPDAATLRLMS